MNEDISEDIKMFQILSQEIDIHTAYFVERA